MTLPTGTPPNPTPHPTTPPPAPREEGMSEGQQRLLIIGVIGVTLAVFIGLVVAAIFLVNNPSEAANIRDIFIIFMALEAFVIGIALVVLIVQMAVLTNLLKNEIKPILEATHDTVTTVRATTLFVSENLTEPIMKLNSYVAGLSKIVETIGTLGSLFRR